MASSSCSPVVSFIVLLLCFAITISEAREARELRRLVHSYCIAYSEASAEDLQRDIDTICGQLDCSSLQPGGPCYDPNTVQNHASVALNLYYKANQKLESACRSFPGSFLALDDPSYGSCDFN